jgi:DNA polymerase III subunit gamma/tau
MDANLPVVEKPLINRYRPESWNQVIGHNDIVTPLMRALKEPSHPHAYLLTGPSGIGKTTIARIIGEQLKADIVEIDAASNSGVDAMRALVEMAEYVPFNASKRMVIIDEAHALSRSSFQAALKLLEEPPPHIYLALATTELNRIPETIRTRCFHVILKPVPYREMVDWLEWICLEENWEVDDSVLDTIIQASTGQPRKALSILQVAHDARSPEEVGRIINLIERQHSSGELGQALLAGKKWEVIRPILASIEMGDPDFEQTKIGLTRYLIAAWLNTESEQRARQIWVMIDAMMFPTTSFDPKSQFYCAVGGILFR